MATQEVKIIKPNKDKAAEVREHNWSVMRPFAHFGVKALSAIAHTLIAIVRNIPKPDAHNDKHTDTRILKK
jgi:hypothetical protein